MRQLPGKRLRGVAYATLFPMTFFVLCALCASLVALFSGQNATVKIYKND